MIKFEAICEICGNEGHLSTRPGVKCIAVLQKILDALNKMDSREFGRLQGRG